MTKKIEKIDINRFGTVIGETAKALKVRIITERDNGESVTGDVWFPKFRAKNNLVSKKFADEKIAEVKNASNPKDMVFIGTPTRETDKAVLVDINFECPHTDRAVTRGVWFPKSMMKDKKVPLWLVDKKVKEVRESVHGTHGLIATIGDYYDQISNYY